jgi:hypothetical protein
MRAFAASGEAVVAFVGFRLVVPASVGVGVAFPSSPVVASRRLPLLLDVFV